ncbi:MAG: Gx transporter family protein [Clostridia bacterium]|nr:Gx transporter family protein [Clostridia bacterium]
MKKTYKLTLSALFCTVALILSYIESLIPPFFAVPGIKLGLSNIISVYLLYTLGFKYAVVVALLRVALSSLLFGTTLTLAYSLTGALVSLLLMYLFKKLSLFSEVGVSIIGGIGHNAAQIAVAAIIMQTSGIIYYLPPLLISGTVTGALIGIAGALLIKKLKFKERF